MEEMSKDFVFALSSLQMKNYDLAIRQFTEVIANESKNYTAIYNRGICYLHEADEKNTKEYLQKAIIDFKRVIELADERGIDHQGAKVNLDSALSKSKLL